MNNKFPASGSEIHKLERPGSENIDLVIHTNKPNEDGISADITATNLGSTTSVRYPLDKDIDGDGISDEAVVSRSDIASMRLSKTEPSSELGSDQWSKATRILNELHILTNPDAMIVDCAIEEDRKTK